MFPWRLNTLCALVALCHCAAAVAAAAPEHWAFRPLKPVSIPAPTNSTWGRNPIDSFILTRLEKEGLAPSPEADPRTLVRRACFDLTGLPPSAETVQRLSAEPGDAAYDRIVAELLNTPRYGEHWARHWLDVAHYADTHGNDHDYARFNAWPYRDYVIQSFNRDTPYPRFIQEQIAGDVLYPKDPGATVALGFLAAGPWDDTLMVTVREDTVDHRMSQVLDRDNMVTTVMSTFQSLTVHCARCHDHKFDPVTQREYYGLQAVFAGVDRAERPYDPDPAVHLKRSRLLARKRAVAARAPAMLASLESAETRAEIAALARQWSAWNDSWKPLDILSVASAGGNSGENFARQADGSWFVSGTRPEKESFLITAQTPLTAVTGLRLEVLPDGRLPKNGPGRFENGNFHLSEVRAWAQPASGKTSGAEAIEFARAAVDHSGDGQGAAGLIDANAQTYWSIHPRYGEPHDATFELKKAVGFTNGTTIIIRLEHEEMNGHQIGRFRLWASSDPQVAMERPAFPAAIVGTLRRAEAERTIEESHELAWYALAVAFDRQLAELPVPHVVYAATHDFAPAGSFKPSPAPRPIHLLARGDINRPGELIGPGTVHCLPGLPSDFSCSNSDAEEGTRRAALAEWLTDARNVLTWRSIVNRVWHYHFGRGLVDTPNDFGRMGGKPSHPELLDWLALWFRDEAKGSFKALHHLILTSATWRQSSMTQQGAAADADNRLLWRANRERLSAEELRDTMLLLSGQLSAEMGGPAAIQFVHHDKATFNTDGAPPILDYEAFDPDAPAARRRAVYRFLFRTVPDPLMTTLDCPDGSTLTPVRSVSTTALQALALLNDRFLIRQCEHLAETISSHAAGSEAQVGAAYCLLLQRSPTSDELTKMTGYAERHGLANACHLLMNSNEFIYLD